MSTRVRVNVCMYACFCDRLESSTENLHYNAATAHARGLQSVIGMTTWLSCLQLSVSILIINILYMHQGTVQIVRTKYALFNSL